MTKIQKFQKWFNYRETNYRIKQIFPNRVRFERWWAWSFGLAVVGGIVLILVVSLLLPHTIVEEMRPNVIYHPLANMIGGMVVLSWIITAIGLMIASWKNKYNYVDVEDPHLENMTAEELMGFMLDKVKDINLQTLLLKFMQEHPDQLISLMLEES